MLAIAFPVAFACACDGEWREHARLQDHSKQVRKSTKRLIAETAAQGEDQVRTKRKKCKGRGKACKKKTKKKTQAGDAEKGRYVHGCTQHCMQLGQLTEHTSCG